MTAKKGKPRRVQQGGRFGRPFDAKKRARFLDLIRLGHSVAWSAPRVGCARNTVAAWLESGRSKRPQKPEHAEFAQAFEEAAAQGTDAIIANLVRLSSTDTKAALALLRSRGAAGFGPTLAQQERLHEAMVAKAEAEAEAAKKGLKDEGPPKIIVIVERDLGGED